MKNVKWTMLMCLAVGFIASACEGSVLFRDDFNDYPGSPARWITYVNDPNRPLWQATALDGWLYTGFGTDATTPPNPQIMLVAGQQAYRSFKSRTDPNDLVSYTWYIKNLIGYYIQNSFLITPVKQTSTAVTKPFVYVYNYLNSNATVTTTLYINNGGSSTTLYTTTYPYSYTDPTQPGKITVKLNSTNYEFYRNDVLLSSGTHGLTLSLWGDNAYTNIYVTHGGSNTGNPTYCDTDYVEISDVDPSAHGTVTLSNYAGDVDPNNPVPIAVRVELRQGPTVVRSEQKILDSNGQFTLDNVTAGTYDVAVKSYTHLQVVNTGVVVSGFSTDLGTFNLPAGDYDGDNEVTSSDLSIVLSNMDTP